ncbi:hypothetical protein MAR_024160 [Mya arenaria]|uniref:Uncharacterized protein n=1 Tax=Mya arenaria TaxID=6604 RepID=A0ABY7DQ09_MYAAR|nr:hypothetical protein MAR_024160 [Mya arenaria]
MATPQKFKRKENWSKAEHKMLRNKSIIFGAAPYCQNSYMCIACSRVISIYLQHSVPCNVPDSSTTKASDGKEEYLLERKNAKFENL